MPAKSPCQKWCWADWFRDTHCLSALAKGVWIDLIGYLYDQTSEGSATFQEEDWCRLLHLTTLEWRRFLAEARTFHICMIDERDGQVTVGSRRLQREKAARAPVSRPQKAVSGPTPEPEAVLRERFARFWAAYPRKIGKAMAWMAWLKIAPDEALLSVMLTGLQRAQRTDQWREHGGKFIPHPTTWLNQRRWEDEYSDGRIPGTVVGTMTPTAKRLERLQAMEADHATH